MTEIHTCFSAEIGMNSANCIQIARVVEKSLLTTML